MDAADRLVGTLAGGAALLAASVFSMLLYIVLYLQNVLASPLPTRGRAATPPDHGHGLRLLAARGETLGTGSAPGADRCRPGLAGAGLLVAGGLDTDPEWTALLAGLLLTGAGIGLVNPTVAEAAIGVVPPAKAATGAAINNTFRQGGVAVGIAALGAVFQERIESRLGDLLANGPPALHGQAGELAPALSSGNAEAAIAAAPPEDGRSSPRQPGRPSSPD